MDVPGFFSEKDKILNFDYSSIQELINTDIDHSTIIENLSPMIKKEKMLIQYFKSILFGYNHIYITKILKDLNNPSANICLPLLHQWEGKTRIDNIIIINHPDDAEKICKYHIKKAPIFKSLLNTSIISTTDNDDWKSQRNTMNPAFLPNLSLKEIFPESVKRARLSSELLIKMSSDYTEPVNMSDFFLNETQAQLQKALFGFSDEFEQQTNQKIRNVFAGIQPEYIKEFTKIALEETMKSNGPASQLFQESNDIQQNIVEPLAPND